MRGCAGIDDELALEGVEVMLGVFGMGEAGRDALADVPGNVDFGLLADVPEGGWILGSRFWGVDFGEWILVVYFWLDFRLKDCRELIDNDFVFENLSMSL